MSVHIDHDKLYLKDAIIKSALNYDKELLTHALESATKNKDEDAIYITTKALELVNQGYIPLTTKKKGS